MSGPKSSTIYGLTPVARALQASPAGQEACVGRELAERYKVGYPEELERVVREAWEAFKAEHCS